MAPQRTAKRKILNQRVTGTLVRVRDRDPGVIFLGVDPAIVRGLLSCLPRLCTATTGNGKGKGTCGDDRKFQLINLYRGPRGQIPQAGQVTKPNGDPSPWLREHHAAVWVWHRQAFVVTADEVTPDARGLRAACPHARL